MIIIEYVEVMQAIITDRIACFYRVDLKKYAFYHLHAPQTQTQPAPHNVNRFICVLGSVLYHLS